jgi:glutathione S-transferase
MKPYGFRRSLATHRVRVALGLKGVAAEEVSIDILKGRQISDPYKTLNPQSDVPALQQPEAPKSPAH